MRKPIIHTHVGLFFAGISLLFTGCSTQPQPNAISKDNYFAQGIEDRIHGKGTAPQLGLALAGGGTKAADFSLGVLQGLTEVGIMDQVDVVSTVSGGGYAALWYFARLLNPKDNPDSHSHQPAGKKFMDKFFGDCIPKKYHKYLSNSTLRKERCPSSDTNYEENSPSLYTDPFRYQNYLRGYQDLFRYTEPVFSYQVTGEDHGEVNGDLFRLALRSAMTIPLSIFSNAIFDWDLPLSASQEQYESGILRTFGAVPQDCSLQPSPCRDKEQLRPTGDTDWVRSGLTFDLLRNEYEQGRIPLWVINTTAGEDRAHPLSPQKDFHLTSFEFSPYGSGSGLFNYSSDRLDDLTPWEAVVTSAAFIDSQQKVLGPVRVVANPLIRVFTFDWGRAIPNPHMPQWQRLSHYILPIPFYSFYGRDGNRPNSFVNIRLSDGGQSENLGAFALVQRNMSDLIISDHGEDQQGTMVDVCRLKQLLANPTDDTDYRKRHGSPRKLFVYFPGLSQLDHVCDQDSRMAMRYDIFQWEHPIVLGCITSKIEDTACLGTPDSESDSFRRIYLIKPALPSLQGDLQFGNTLGRAATACAEGAGSDACLAFFTTQPDLCTDVEVGAPYTLTSSKISEWQFETHLSCELLGFLMKNSFVSGKPKQKGFPQLSTAALTANSSPWVFGAYRELGRYYARQLGWFWGITGTDRAGNKALRQARFTEAVKNQWLHPVLPIQEDSWQLVQERLQQQRP